MDNRQVPGNQKSMTLVQIQCKVRQCIIYAQELDTGDISYVSVEFLKLDRQ